MRIVLYVTTHITCENKSFSPSFSLHLVSSLAPLSRGGNARAKFAGGFRRFNIRPRRLDIQWTDISM